uniref:CCHC-type domain-containing protein n=1 Tax=Octopus bimaculoides TaxID=37653 RepID=A0A0L8HMP0_OCTBM
MSKTADVGVMVHISLPDLHKIVEEIILPDETRLRIMVEGRLLCFECRVRGHMKAKCPQKQEQEVVEKESQEEIVIAEEEEEFTVVEKRGNSESPPKKKRKAEEKKKENRKMWKQWEIEHKGQSLQQLWRRRDGRD